MFKIFVTFKHINHLKLGLMLDTLLNLCCESRIGAIGSAHITQHLCLRLNFRIVLTTVALPKSTRARSFVELQISINCTNDAF